MNNHTRIERRRILKKIIAEKQISDQTQLLRELKKRHIDTTQATISRDLREMGVVKTRTKPGIFKYELTAEVPADQLIEKLRYLFDNFVTGIKSVNNLLLIKTTPGNAHGIASLIDRLDQKNILGTIAGDDTILIITDSNKSRQSVQKTFNNLSKTTR